MLRKLYQIVFVLFSVVLLIGCTYEMKKVDNITLDNRWRGEFIVQNKEVPFVFSLTEEPLNIDGYRIVILNGGEKDQLETVQIEGQNLKVALSYDQKDVLEGIIRENEIEGKLRKKVSDTYLESPFKAYKSNEPRFKKIEEITDIFPDGMWILKYDTLKNLKNNADLFRHNIDRFVNLQLFRKDNEIIGSIKPIGQGFEGVMTANGFICSSFYKSEPYLMEGEFINDQEFKGTITTLTDIYTFNALKQSDNEVTAETSENALKTLILLIKSYFEYR